MASAEQNSNKKRAYDREYAEKARQDPSIRAKMLERTRVWRAKNKAYLANYNKKWQHENKGLVKEINRRGKLRAQYGLTEADWEALFIAQNGACAICENQLQLSGRKVHVDHSHKTSKVRALLCNRCNSVIGYANDCAFILTKALAYLEKFNG